MNALMLALAGWLAAMANPNTQSVDPDCGRYLNAMQNPDVVAVLEAWRARLPETFDRKKYPRVWESSGFGGYSFALDFNPTTLGLKPTAHAEVSVDPRNGKVRFAAISDALGSGFVFRFKGYEYRFEGTAMKSPRSGYIGVACRTPRGG